MKIDIIIGLYLFENLYQVCSKIYVKIIKIFSSVVEQFLFFSTLLLQCLFHQKQAKSASKINKKNEPKARNSIVLNILKNV